MSTQKTGWPGVFGIEDVGCYVDGTYGVAHRRVVLVSLLEALLPAAECLGNWGAERDIRLLITSLGGEPTDDLWEEDESVAMLQEHTADGLVWQWDAGDLLLVKEDEIA